MTHDATPDWFRPLVEGTPSQNGPKSELVAVIGDGRRGRDRARDPDEIAREEMAQGSAPRPLGSHGWSEVMAPLPPTPWICRGIQLVGGRPSLLTGGAGGGKTYVAMSLALAVGAGLASWLDCFPLQKTGGVVHINLEMSTNELYRRYQRLARGMGLEEKSVDLQVINRGDLPAGFSLAMADQALLLRTLVATCAGKTLCIIDSFRAFIGNIDENKTEARLPLDVLLSTFDQTGCAFLVIHHEGKPPKEGNETGGSTQHRARGSSGIVDACEMTYSLSKASFPSGMEIEQGKASMDVKTEPFFVRLVDIGDRDEDGRSVAIRVEYVHPEEAARLGQKEPKDVAAAKAGILDALRIHGSLNRRQIDGGHDAEGVMFVFGTKAAKSRAIDGLLADSAIMMTRHKNNEMRFSIPP